MTKTKREQTEERILEAALNLFSEKGYAGTATSEIAREAQVAEGTIFRYFPQKKDLLLKVVMKFIDTFGEQIVLSSLEKLYSEHPEATPEELLKLIILDRFALLEKMGGHIRVLLIEMQYHPELVTLFADSIGAKAVRFGERVFGGFAERGLLRKDVLPMMAFRSFVGMAMMMFVQRRFLVSETPPQMTLEDEIDLLIDVFMNGVRCREGNR